MYWVTSQLVWGCPDTKGLILGISLLTRVAFLEIYYTCTNKCPILGNLLLIRVASFQCQFLEIFCFSEA